MNLHKSERSRAIHCSRDYVKIEVSIAIGNRKTMRPSVPRYGLRSMGRYSNNNESPTLLCEKKFSRLAGAAADENVIASISVDIADS
jgi:hypothetical protein